MRAASIINKSMAQKGSQLVTADKNVFSKFGKPIGMDNDSSIKFTKIHSKWFSLKGGRVGHGVRYIFDPKNFPASLPKSRANFETPCGYSASSSEEVEEVPSSQ